MTKLRSYGRVALLSTMAFASCCMPLKADMIQIQGVVDPATPLHGVQIYIKLNINDNNGNPLVINALVDTGDNGRIDFSGEDAAAIGLTPGMAANVEADGGPVPGLNNTFVNGGRNPSVSGETDSNSTFNLQSDVIGQATMGGAVTTVGTQFFNIDPAGPGEVDLNYVTGTVTIYNHLQAVLHGLPGLKTLLLTAPAGDFDVDPNGTGYAVNVDVGSGTFSSSAPFVISSGVGLTAISPAFASALGLACSGPPLTFSAEIGDVTAPSATVSINLFSAQPSETFQVGCLSSAQDPLNENFLGADFLGQYSSIYLDAATSTFAATTASPEPATLSLAFGGLVAVILIRTCRWRQGRAAAVQVL